MDFNKTPKYSPMYFCSNWITELLNGRKFKVDFTR